MINLIKELENISSNSQWSYFYSKFPASKFETKRHLKKKDVNIFEYKESDIKLEDISKVLKTLLTNSNEFKFLFDTSNYDYDIQIDCKINERYLIFYKNIISEI